MYDWNNLTFGGDETDVSSFAAFATVFGKTETAGAASHVYPQGVQKFWILF